MILCVNFILVFYSGLYSGLDSDIREETSYLRDEASTFCAHQPIRSTAGFSARLASFTFSMTTSANPSGSMEIKPWTGSRMSGTPSEARWSISAWTAWSTAAVSSPVLKNGLTFLPPCHRRSLKREFRSIAPLYKCAKMPEKDSGPALWRGFFCSYKRRK